MMKFFLIAAGLAAGLYILSPKKKERPGAVRPPKPGLPKPSLFKPPPAQVKEPTLAPEGWREIFEDGLVDAVATCAARELPDDYDAAYAYIKSCTMDLIFPHYLWPPVGGGQWKMKLWTEPSLHSAVEASLRTPGIPGP